MKQYDIFISYRRSSYDIANLIATRLKSAGYSVFFDMEALRSGKFNEQLYGVIDNCKDFIAVLPPGALDRCVNDDDWVRLEICRAMTKNKNIVPVMLNGFAWPSPMPNGMEELCNYQALTASSTEYFDMAMDRLQERYLHSKRHLPMGKLLKFVGVGILSLLALISIVGGVFLFLSHDVCQKYATNIVKDAGVVHVIAEQNNGLWKDWHVFCSEIAHETRTDRIEALQEEMLARVDLTEENLKAAWQIDSVEMDVSNYHSFLLSLHGINAEEMKVSPVFATLYYKDYLDQLSIVRNAINTPNTMNMRFASVLFEVFVHSANGYYAAVLSELSPFPDNSLTVFEQMSPEWIYFPSEYKIGEDDSYYESIMYAENKKAEELMSRYESQLEIKDANVEDAIRKTNMLEEQINEGFEQIESRIDSTAQILNAASEYNKLRQDNERELALRREKVNAKKVAVEASKAELTELDKQYVQTYESLKEKCTMEESDDQWYKWGKIRRWGMFLSMMVESRKQLEAQGIHSTSSITPEIAYADMNSLLSVYQTYHPEAKDYVASAKAFYREVSKGKRSYSGTIVFGFKDDAVHPVLKKGDIITHYNGKSVKNYEELKTAFKQNEDGKVTFIRLLNSKFTEMYFQWEETGIVGFLDLTE